MVQSKTVNKYISLILLIFSHFVYAQNTYNPMQEPQFAEDVSINADPVWSDQLKEKFSKVRVKIFPHNSKYNAPHGKDETIHKLNVSSQGDCNIYKSDFPTSEQEFTRKTLLNSGKSFDLTTTTVTDPIWIECTQPIEIKRPDFPNNSVRYQGMLFIKTISAVTSYLTVVNVLPFEQYLKGVVPSEMPASWSAEALKVQAIAARTYAYHELGSEVANSDKNILLEKSGAQIDDTVTYQAYLGLKNGAASTDKAIDDTQGMVLTYNKKVIKAYFSADSGGYTENSENVWGDAHPYILAKPELYPEGSIPGTSWSFTTPIKEVGKKLISSGFLAPEDELESLFIDKNDLFPSSRPKFVELKLTNGSKKKISAVDYSFATRIKSAWIQFAGAEQGNVIVSGKGFGHGAGMSQWGARVMVDTLKKKYDEILKFYYTDVEISK